ncbi:DNA replication/repair protein RecF [Sinomicrobium soli]|uniref:DNA replication/repair protein RecF n=1 Tax=Sinomicrobium sp. N-1-3-6 TaxID=2219864 RepID=UPI000DCD75AF|nr:DNA replication and repair protein RecF [Sinomicrobium sp. N-1-3-6]RAV30450.1 DNA replication and repair protein RecF [Sinomicrobium sp. N-1-3-6]
MFLKKLSLVNYKNFKAKDFEFDEKINCLVGNNGIGKTNVLDAIYHLSFGKSYFNPIAIQNIRHGEDFFVVDGLFRKSGHEEHVICSLKKGQKKSIKRNGKAYDKLSDHIGFLPLVIISPADRDLIVEGSETRRKFMDSVISQSDKTYLNHLIQYNRALSQRNSLLKYFALNHTYDHDTLGIYNEQLHLHGSAIFRARVEFLKVFVPIFLERYRSISDSDENVNIAYSSALSEQPLDELLKNTINKDRALQYTSTGIHRDDLSLEIDGFPIKKFGSQGQQKSFLVALKLAQFDFIKQQAGVSPILLLDDIFDKLDENRVTRIVKLMENNFGQLFISDTHADRTEAVVQKTARSYKMFRL